MFLPDLPRQTGKRSSTGPEYRYVRVPCRPDSVATFPRTRVPWRVRSGRYRKAAPICDHPPASFDTTRVGWVVGKLHSKRDKRWPTLFHQPAGKPAALSAQSCSCAVAACGPYPAFEFDIASRALMIIEQPKDIVFSVRHDLARLSGVILKPLLKSKDNRVRQNRSCALS